MLNSWGALRVGIDVRPELSARHVRSWGVRAPAPPVTGDGHSQGLLIFFCSGLLRPWETCPGRGELAGAWGGRRGSGVTRVSLAAVLLLLLSFGIVDVLQVGSVRLRV